MALAFALAAVATAAACAAGWAALRLYERAEAARQAVAGEARLRREAAERGRREIEALRRELERQRHAVALLEDPATRFVALAPRGGARGAVRALVGASRGGLAVAGDLPSMPGRDYELWVVHGDEKLAAGLLRPDARGAALVEIDARVLAAGADALSVTIEPEGGGRLPTGAEIFFGAVPAAPLR